MADSYHIIDGKVIPFSGGRKCNDTDAWRDATQLELHTRVSDLAGRLRQAGLEIVITSTGLELRQRPQRERLQVLPQPEVRHAGR